MLRTPAIFAVLVVLVCIERAGAHALLADCRQEGDKVTVEAFYDDTTPAAKASVKVLDSARKIIVEGQTDAKGFWAFPMPRPGDYQVIVDAGAGHRATKRITIREKSDKKATEAPSSPDTASRSAAAQFILESDGDPRESSSLFWLKLAIGFLVIAVLAAGYLIARRYRLDSLPDG